MDQSTLSPPADPAAVRLQRDIHYQTDHYLAEMLPRPDGEPPEYYQRRFRVAVAEVAAFMPSTPTRPT